MNNLITTIENGFAAARDEIAALEQGAVQILHDLLTTVAGDLGEEDGVDKIITDILNIAQTEGLSWLESIATTTLRVVVTSFLKAA